MLLGSNSESTATHNWRPNGVVFRNAGAGWHCLGNYLFLVPRLLNLIYQRLWNCFGGPGWKYQLLKWKAFFLEEKWKAC